MGGELSLNPIRVSPWPMTISFLINNNSLNSALASLLRRQDTTAFISYVNNALNQKINSWHTENSSCYWKLEVLFFSPTWRVACVFQMNLKVRASCMKHGGATRNDSIFGHLCWREGKREIQSHRKALVPYTSLLFIHPQSTYSVPGIVSGLSDMVMQP